MIDADDLKLRPAERTWAAQAEAFARGRWTPLQVLEAYAQRIARLNPALNAVLDTRLEAARREAAASADRWAAGRPLSGLDGAVVAVKANIAVEGLPWHAGVRAYERRFAARDAEAVARLKAAGAVVLATVNMEEGALGAVTDNPWFGRTLNPWGLDREADLTPGGSSGGSAAAVAAGLCVMALGTDTMGSVRIPAAYCGVAGHKPSRGLIPLDGVTPLSTTLDHVGPIARSARDLAAWTGALAGRPPAPAGDLGGLAVGRWRFEDAVEAAPGVIARFEAALSALAARGARIVDVAPTAYAYGRSRRMGLLLAEREGAAVHAAALAETPDGFSPGFRKMLAWGAGQPEAKAEAARAHLELCRADAEAWFAELDLVLAPTALEAAFPFGTPAPASQADLTAFADFAGCPATSVCAGLDGDALPVGVQVIAPIGADARAIAAAEVLERDLGGPFVPPGV